MYNDLIHIILPQPNRYYVADASNASSSAVPPFAVLSPLLLLRGSARVYTLTAVMGAVRSVARYML